MLSDPAIQSSFTSGFSSAEPSSLHWPEPLATKWPSPRPTPLGILHVLRAPVGGLFRHVCDLAKAQAAAGHLVGVVVDATTYDSLTTARLDALSEHLALGLSRTPMARNPSPRDVVSARAVAKIARACGIDVIHGHGAKGGAFARLAGRQLRKSSPQTKIFYTPHGGALHYAPTSIAGRIFGVVERSLATHTSGIIFESAHAARAYHAQVKTGAVPTRVIPNGVHDTEFERVAYAPNSADFLFVGELRHLKGIDVLLAAMAKLGHDDTTTLAVVGDGPDRARFERLSANLGLTERVTFHGAMPARTAFALGRTLVMPSRQESLPYILLEAGAAGVPIIASNVGGVPEIVDGTTTKLVAPGDIADLASALRHMRAQTPAITFAAETLRTRVGQRFTVASMSDTIHAFYAHCGAGKVKSAQT